MKSQFIKIAKSLACFSLSAILAIEAFTPIHAGVSDNSITESDLTGSLSENAAGDNDDVSLVADDELQEQEKTDEAEADETDLTAEQMKEGETIYVSFYDVSGNTTVPFYDKDTGAVLLSDIPITRTDGSAYLDESFSAEDNAIYSMMEPQNPRPWLRFMPVRRGYQVTKWVSVKSGREYDAYLESGKNLYDSVDLSSLKQGAAFRAKYDNTPYEFKIQYHTDGGQLPRRADASSMPESFNVTTNTIVLPALEKSGYTFDGWYQDAAFTVPVSTIPQGTYIDSDAYGFVSDYELYAKWSPISVPRASISSLRNTKKGTIKLTYKKISDVSGYEICFARTKSFKKNTNTFDNGSKTSYLLSNLPQGTYYFKVRAYKYDSTGEKIYGVYSKVKSCKVKKGVKEYDASSASVKLKKAAISKGSTLVVQASAAKRIKSADDSYYLVRINSQTGKFENKAANIVASLPKQKTMKYQLPLTDDTKAALLQGCYAIAIKTEKGYSLVSNSLLVSNPEAAATYTAAFPQTKTPSKKGMQGAGGDSNLGIQHFFFNIDIATILSNANDPNATPYTYKGKTYYFNLQDYARTISIANQQGLVVTAQIGMSWPGSSKTYLISSGGRIPGHSYYSLNFKTAKARDELEAVFSFMAESFSTPKCHLDNWILGNEVNMHKDWYFAGNITRTQFMKNYTDTFRGLYYAVKGYSKNARVYICLDHNWAGTDSVWGAKPFMDDFNTSIHALNKKISWNLAYHLYPQNLNNAATWNDMLATQKTSSPYVTPKNLEVMTKYVKKKFGQNTRIILSEQGFTSNSGTAVQAAGIAYTFYKAQFNDMIDAVIFHRYQDEPSELNTGTGQPLNYGICYTNGQAKPDSYNTFKFMDTPAYQKYTDACLQTIGIASWSDIAKNFDPGKLVNMP